jgi:adenylate cyclase
MKRCPECRRDYYDDSLLYCLEDGTALVQGSVAAPDESPTAILSRTGHEPKTAVFDVGEALGAAEAVQSGPSTEFTRSIAVLPFTNMSADAENEYFCDGLAEELLNGLGKVEGLKVAARTSAFSFKGKDSAVSDIAKALNVSTVLEGSVRRSAERIRISAQLVNAEDGYHLWSERYDREMKDIFALQDEITAAVVDALKLKLLGLPAPDRRAKSHKALDLYLKGRFLFEQHTAESFDKAASYFEDAIREDPEYALAYAGLSSVLIFEWFFGLVLAHEAIPRAREAALKAIERDPGLDEAHVALGHVLMFYERDLVEAEREYALAVRLGPQNPYARYQYALCLAVLRRNDDAIEQAEKAIEIDPLSILANFQLSAFYYHLGMYDAALMYSQRLIDMAPAFYGGHLFKGSILLVRGDFPAAIAILEDTLRLDPRQDFSRSFLGQAYGLSGQRERALELARELEAEREIRCVNAFHIARIYDALGETEKTLTWLERALEERNGELVYMRLYAERDRGNIWGPALCSDTRFQDFLERLHLPG